MQLNSYNRIWYLSNYTKLFIYLIESDDCKILATFNGYSKDEELRRYQVGFNYFLSHKT